MNLLACATHTVGDADAAAARFARWMDYATVEHGVVDTALAAAWGTPASAGRRYTLCRPASGADAFLRFVDGDPVPAYAPLRSFGWAAIELCVQDVAAVNARMEDSPFEIIGPPLAIPGLATIHPMQVRGPDREVIYLTQILDGAPGGGLPRADSAIDRPFILVLACADIRASARWFAGALGLAVDDPIAIRYRMISQAFGLPAETTHELMTVRHDRDIFLELAQYPPGTIPRPGAPDALPPGVSIGTLHHPDLATIAARWLSPPAPREGMLYAGRRAGTLRAPGGALIEVIDAGEDPS